MMVYFKAGFSLPHFLPSLHRNIVKILKYFNVNEIFGYQCDGYHGRDYKSVKYSLSDPETNKT